MLVHWDRLVERKTNELRKQKSVVWRAVERKKRMKINRTREFFLLCHTTTIQSREQCNASRVSRKFHLLLYSEGCKVARRMTPWLMRVVLIDICWFLWPMEKRKAGEWEIALGKSFQEFIGWAAVAFWTLPTFIHSLGSNFAYIHFAILCNSPRSVHSGVITCGIRSSWTSAVGGWFNHLSYPICCEMFIRSTCCFLVAWVAKFTRRALYLFLCLLWSLNFGFTSLQASPP